MGSGGAIIQARENVAATLIATQLEPNELYLRINGELMADSILGRTAGVANYLDIEGPDMREYSKNLWEGKGGTK